MSAAWAVVNTDNFGGDYPDEWFAARSIPNKPLVERIAKFLNGPSEVVPQPRYFKVEEEPYALQPGFEP